MEQIFFLAFTFVALCIAILALVKVHKSQKQHKSLTSQIVELKDNLAELLWQDKSPYVRFTYTVSKAKEHLFDIEIINILSESITLLDLITYPQSDKLTYSEVGFPLERNEKTGLMRVDRLNYTDKISVDRIKSPLGINLAPNQHYQLKYTLKFKESMFTGRKPDIFLSYQSDKHKEIKEMRLAEQTISATKDTTMRPMKSLVPGN
jgi:hypothetical protein